jgi:hypothetical protein
MPVINATDICTQTGCGIQAQFHAQVSAQCPTAGTGPGGSTGYFTETIYVCPQSLHSEQQFVAQANFGT